MNITNQPVPAGPITDPTVLAGGIFEYDDASLEGIRMAMGSFAPGATIFVDPNGTMGWCPEGQVCLGVDFAPTPLSNAVPIIGGSFPFDQFNASLLPRVKLEDQVQGTAFEQLGAFHSPGDPAYEIDFDFDPQFPGVRVQSAFDPSALLGMWLGGSVDFVPAFERDFACDCVSLPDPAPLPDNRCTDVCDGLWDNLGGFTESCEVFLRIRLNSAGLELGFLPMLPATNTGLWTTGFFPEAKDFHLPHMFDLPLVARGGWQLTVHDGFTDVSNDTQSGTAIAAAVSGCNGKCLWWDCNTPVAQQVGHEVAVTVATKLANAIEAKLAPLFDYDKPALPAPCTVPPDVSPQSCTEAETEDLLAASLTYQKWSWFRSGAGLPEPSGPIPTTAIWV